MAGTTSSLHSQGGGLHGPPFLFLEDDAPLHEGLEARIAHAIEPTLNAMGYEIVRVLIQGKQTPTVQIMADRADGAPIGVGDCEKISHAAGAVLDVDDPFSGEWNLEVSSPGIDRPLTRTKDWLRFAGHVATVEMSIPIEGRRRFRGIILGADESEIRLRLDEGAEIALPRPDMRRAKLVLTDELIAATAAEVARHKGENPDGDSGEDDAEPPFAKRN
ncbi:ribosome maturation factor RimP [Pseudoroseomonas globiformis]|uniref:Ribosome maturation factor RimP n=1 Tax=Teichococcus globiformis TaxID=2307229 RepID=A0ABV7FXR2_9PROT